MDEQLLLIDCCNHVANLELVLDEGASKTTDALVKFRGKFQEAEAVNKNKRTYPFEVLDESVKRLQPLIEARSLIGELDHPTDSIVHFANASHVITKLWWEGNALMGEGEILNTPHGKVLKALINDGVGVGISSRGVGSGKTNEDGILVIGESYRLITFDAVADPSTFGAFQKKVVSKENVAPSRIDVTQEIEASAKQPIKNESSSIHTSVNKDALIACIGGFVKSQSEEIKSRLTNG